MPQSSKRWYVNGYVQGVGFRFFVHKKAVPLGLAGYARNLPDGRVEVYATGEQARLEDLAQALQRGPAASRVTDVVAAEAEFEPYSGFQIR